MSGLANQLLALVIAMLIPLYTSSPGRVIPSAQEEEFAPPNIWSWSYQDGTLGPGSGPPLYLFHNFIPEDEEIVPVAGLPVPFPAAIDPTMAYVGRLRFVIDPSEIGNIDRNRSFDRQCYYAGPPEDALDHMFVRQWMLFGTPIDTNIWVQRKLLYLRSDIDFNADWCMIVTGFSPPGATGAPVQLVGADVNSGIDAYNLTLPGGAQAYSIPWNTWQGLELEVFANTPGISDGRCQIWVYDTDGTVLVNHEWTGLNIRGSSTKQLEIIASGSQADRINTGEAVNELRWVTRHALSTQRMGP